jgi:hypothetical protein
VLALIGILGVHVSEICDFLAEVREVFSDISHPLNHTLNSRISLFFAKSGSVLIWRSTGHLWLRVFGIAVFVISFLASPDIASAIENVKTEFEPVFYSELVTVVDAADHVGDILRPTLKALWCTTGQAKRNWRDTVWSQDFGQRIFWDDYRGVGSHLLKLIEEKLVLCIAHPFSISIEPTGCGGDL